MTTLITAAKETTSQRALQSQGGFESSVRVKQQTKSVLPSVAAGHHKRLVRIRPR